jgi:transcriptional regulator with XRE-family HTH domain
VKEAEYITPSRRKELGAFLRAHRERRRPEDVGLVPTGRRRAPGLRREEVATLSGVGIAWYSWLEQGRVVSSRNVLDAVARTLDLDGASYRHLLGLAGYQPHVASAPLQDSIVRRIQPMLDAWESSPALLLDGCFDIMAWNGAYSAVWSDPADLPVSRRNYMWSMVSDPVRERLVGWEPAARAVLAQFRAQTARHVDDPRVQELYEILRTDFPELGEWWECQGVSDLTTREITVALSGGCRINLAFSAFRPVDSPESLVLTQLPVTQADQALASRLARARSRMAAPMTTSAANSG